MKKNDRMRNKALLAVFFPALFLAGLSVSVLIFAGDVAASNGLWGGFFFLALMNFVLALTGYLLYKGKL